MLFKSECRFFKKPLSLNYSTQNGVRYRFKNGVRLDDGSYHLDNGIVIKSSVHPADIAGLLGAHPLYNLLCDPLGGIRGKDNVELYMNGDEFAPKNLDEKQVKMGFGEKQHLSNVIGLGLRFPSLFDYACQYQCLMNTKNWTPDEFDLWRMSKNEDCLKDLRKQLESEYGKSIKLDPFTEEEQQQISRIFDLVIEGATTSEIKPLAYLYRNQELILCNQSSLSPKVNLE